MTREMRPQERAFATMYDETQGRTKGTPWRMVEAGLDGQIWMMGELKVIWSVAVELDGAPWLHVSASRPTRIPSYLDMTYIKDTFVGTERFAYSVWAPRAEHISIHDYCLHLWCKLDGPPPLPDFTRGLGTI